MASPHSKRIGEDATSTRSRHAPTVGRTGWLRPSTISRPTSGTRDQNANSMPAAAELPAGEVRRTTGSERRAKMKRVGGQTIGGRVFASGEIAEWPAAWPRTTRCPGAAGARGLNNPSRPCKASCGYAPPTTSCRGHPSTHRSNRPLPVSRRLSAGNKKAATCFQVRLSQEWSDPGSNRGHMDFQFTDRLIQHRKMRPFVNGLYPFSPADWFQRDTLVSRRAMDLLNHEMRNPVLKSFCVDGGYSVTSVLNSSTISHPSAVRLSRHQVLLWPPVLGLWLVTTSTLPLSKSTAE